MGISISISKSLILNLYRSQHDAFWRFSSPRLRLPSSVGELQNRNGETWYLSDALCDRARRRLLSVFRGQEAVRGGSEAMRERRRSIGQRSVGGRLPLRPATSRSKSVQTQNYVDLRKSQQGLHQMA